MGCALTYNEVFRDELVLKVAAITKLTRNLFLAVVIPGLAWMSSTATQASSAITPSSRLLSIDTVKKYMPMFVAGFLGMSLLRSVGDSTLASHGLAFGCVEAEAWKSTTTTVGNVLGSHYLLGTAMAAVGLNTSVSVFKGVGWRPFALGLGGSAIVGMSAAAAVFAAEGLLDVGHAEVAEGSDTSETQ